MEIEQNSYAYAGLKYCVVGLEVLADKLMSKLQMDWPVSNEEEEKLSNLKLI